MDAERYNLRLWGANQRQNRTFPVGRIRLLPALFRNFGFGRLPGALRLCPPSPKQQAARLFDLVLKSTLALLQLTESQHRAELRSEYPAGKGLKEGKSATSRM